jgi:hypothetical protein
MNVMAPLIDHYVVEANIKEKIKRVNQYIIKMDKDSNKATFISSVMVVDCLLLSVTAISLSIRRMLGLKK